MRGEILALQKPTQILSDGRISVSFTKMQVSFRTLDGKEHVLELDPGLRLSEVKAKLAELLNWSVSEVKLLLKEYEDDVTLESLDLAPSSYIAVCKRSLTTRKVAPAPPAPAPPAPPEPELEAGQEQEPATTVSPRPEEPSVQPLPNLTGQERPEPSPILEHILAWLDPEGRVAVRDTTILEEERTLTENERNLVSQLVEMCGMDRMTVLQVFNACGHDGNTTANVLLSLKNEKHK